MGVIGFIINSVQMRWSPRKPSFPQETGGPNWGTNWPPKGLGEFRRYEASESTATSSGLTNAMSIFTGAGSSTIPIGYTLESHLSAEL